MDSEKPIISQLEDEYLEEVAGGVGADHEHLGWVGVGFDFNNNDRMVDRVEDICVGDPMTSGRAMNLHTLVA